MRVLAVLALVVGLAAPAAAQLTVKGDGQAWQEVVAAYQRLTAIRAYRMKISGSTLPGPVTVEVVNPDRRRSVVSLGARGTMEIIVVGRDARSRTGVGPWQCQAPPMGPGGFGPGFPDPKTVKGEVTVTRVGAVTVEGIRTQGYRVAYGPAGSDQQVHTRVYVLADGGLPRRTDVYGSDGKVATTIDYYDFNAPVTIELPKCN